MILDLKIDLKVNKMSTVEKIFSFTEINCTNILRAAFLPISFGPKNTNANCKYRKALHNSYTFIPKNCLQIVGEIETKGRKTVTGKKYQD